MGIFYSSCSNWWRRGGGKGGWGSNKYDGFGAGGGGGGAIFVSKTVPLAPATPIQIAVGTGGPGADNVNTNNAYDGGETSIKINGLKVFGAGGGRKGVCGWNKDDPTTYTPGVGGVGGTVYIDSNYTSYEFQKSTGGNGTTITYTTTGTITYTGGKGGDISMSFSGTPAYYSNISYTGANGGSSSGETGGSGQGYGSGGGGGAGNQDTGAAAGGNGGTGAKGYARIFFYI
jgi:hypothetical protein